MYSLLPCDIQVKKSQDTHICSLKFDRFHKVITAILYPYMMLYPEIFHSIKSSVGEFIVFDGRSVKSLIDFKMIQSFGA